ncbi:MAG: cytochrome c [Gemmatimonadetes bacterium]|nr:cytochrome c [Gemmatimonadota bacterium]
MRAASAGPCPATIADSGGRGRRGRRHYSARRDSLARYALLVLLLCLTGCTRDQWQRFPSPDDLIAAVPWFAVMHRGIAIQPYQMPRPPVPGTVPVTGTEVADTVIPAYYPRINRLVNPVQRTSESLDRGRELYRVYCVPCHGDAGHGDGPITPKFIRPPDLALAPARAYTDGYLYALVASGRGLMPPYGDKVRGPDRWHVVNYLRGVIQAGAP